MVVAGVGQGGACHRGGAHLGEQGEIHCLSFFLSFHWWSAVECDKVEKVGLTLFSPKYHTREGVGSPSTLQERWRRRPGPPCTVSWSTLGVEGWVDGGMDSTID